MNINIHFQPEVGSTNDWAKELAAAGAPEGTLAVADRQTAGKGRRGRAWQTEKGTSIAMSLILRPEIQPEHASMLTLVMGLSVAQGITAATGLETSIKWPNDVVAQGKKLCGILTEMSAGMDGIHYVVVGTGINVNNTAFPEELSEIATSLFLELGEVQDKNLVMDAVIDAFTKNYELFFQHENLKELQNAYDALLINKDKEVRVLDPKEPFEGVARGITPTGELLVERTKDGQMTAVYAGEVSVRGLYSYV